MELKYDIEADWNLLDGCNFRCAYCFSPPDVLASKLRTYATAQEWAASFDAAGCTWLVHMTGGEPSIYPGFVDLCAAITQRHFISINSNLTYHRSLTDFAERIDPSRISFINAALHLEERERRTATTAFIRNVDLLRSKGFPVLVSLVATPSALARFEGAQRLLEPTGLTPIPKLFRGVFNGQTYPKAYSDDEKHRFRTFCQKARQVYQPIFERNSEWPSIDMLHDDRHLDGVPSFTGVSCDAGHRFVRITADGDVQRCGEGETFGNILARTFAPRQRPTPCNNEYCYYWCNKYTLPDRTRSERGMDYLAEKVRQVWPALAVRGANPPEHRRV
jgi:MoaA/NifB/PqqE/SkfB family radical SAM enzyme